MDENSSLLCAEGDEGFECACSDECAYPSLLLPLLLSLFPLLAFVAVDAATECWGRRELEVVCVMRVLACEVDEQSTSSRREKELLILNGAPCM